MTNLEDDERSSLGLALAVVVQVEGDVAPVGLHLVALDREAQVDGLARRRALGRDELSPAADVAEDAAEPEPGADLDLAAGEHVDAENLVAVVGHRTLRKELWRLLVDQRLRVVFLW